MLRLKDLSSTSLRHGLIRMNKRIGFGSYMGTTLTPLAFYFAPGNLLATPVGIACCLTLVYVMIVNALLTHFANRIFDWPNGIKKWRALFLIHSTLYAVGVGVAVSYMLTQLGGGIYGTSLTTALLFGCIVAVSSFAFDIVSCAVYLVAILTPPIYTCFFLLPEGLLAGLTCSMAGVFFLYLAYSIRNAEVGAMVQDDLIKRQAGELQTSNSLFKSTLTSIDEIFLTIDLNGICFGNISPRYEATLGVNPVGLSFMDILRVAPSNRPSAQNWFAKATKDADRFEKLRAHGPPEWHDAEHDRTYRVQYFPMVGKDGLNAVIMTMSDVTAQLVARRATADAEARAAMILALSENRPLFRALIKELTGYLEHLSSDGARVELLHVRQQLHTFKGTAKLLELRKLGKAINDLEDDLRPVTTDVDPRLPDRARVTLKTVRDLIESERDLLTKLRLLQAGELSATGERVQLIRESFLGAPSVTFDEVVMRLNAVDLSEITAAFQTHVERLGQRLGKAVTLDVSASSRRALLLNSDLVAPFKALIHVFNNAIDHGIESAAERALAGKPERARITMDWALKDGAVTITIGDDGRGVDVANVRRLLNARGIDATAMSDHEVVQTIFQPGLTTKTRANDLSGHGVGLNALHEAVRAVGGRALARSTAGFGTTLTLVIPAGAGDVLAIEPGARARVA